MAQDPAPGPEVPGYPTSGQQPYPGGYGYGGPPMQPSNGAGTAALVLGIISLVIGGAILGIPAIFLGRKGMQRAQQGTATNGGMAKAGFILGIISTALSVVGIIVIAVSS